MYTCPAAPIVRLSSGIVVVVFGSEQGAVDFVFSRASVDPERLDISPTFVTYDLNLLDERSFD